MMLNEIISITNPGDMLSGTGKSQSLRDGAFVGLCQSTDDLDPQQNNFMSVLSQFGNGTVPMVSEEASGSNLKQAEETLSDEAPTDIPASEKLKEKSGKSSAVSKRLTSVHPEVFAFVMGLLSIPDPPQSTLSADPAFHTPGLKSEENSASGLIAGESMPETMKNQRLPDESIILAGMPQMSPSGLSGSDLAQAAQIEVSPKSQGQRQPDPTSVKDASIKGSAIKDPAQVFQGVEVQAQQEENPDSVSISGPIFSRLDSAQFFQGEQLPKLQGQRQPDPTSVKDASIKGSAIKDPAQDFQGVEVQAHQQPDLTSVKDASKKGSAIKDPAQDFQGVEVPVQQKENPDSVSISSPDFTRLDSVQFFQGEQLPKLQGQWQLDPTSVKDSSIKGLAIKDPAQIFQGMEVPVQQQKKNPDSVSISGSVVPRPDMIHVNPLTENKNLGAKENITQENSAESVIQNTSVTDKVPVIQKEDPAIWLQGVRAKSGSFHQTEDAIETDGIASPSTSAINADIVGTMDAFKSADAPAIFTGSDDDPQLQPLEPGSRDSVANFAREAQMEKTTSANLSPKEIRHVNQSFQAEVLKQVVEKSASTLKSGQSEIQIDLKPESLGHLRLHVSMENQQVTVKILAENTQVKEMIERQAYLIKNELQHQGIKVDAVNVDMLMSGGSDFAYSQHEETAFKQARNAPAYGSGQERSPEIEFREPDSQGQGNSRGGYLVNYFA